MNPAKGDRSHIILIDRRTMPPLTGGRDMPENNDPQDKRADLIFRLARGLVLTAIVEIALTAAAYLFCLTTSGGEPLSAAKLLLTLAVLNTVSIGISHATQ